MATYADLVNIRNSNDFGNRCAISVANYARFIMGEASTVDNHRDRLKWAALAIDGPSSIVSQYGSAIILDAVFTALPNGTTDSSTLTDAQIDGAVQATLNNFVI